MLFLFFPKYKGWYQSSQMDLTVNQVAFAFGGANPSQPTDNTENADLAQVAERFHGKEKVVSSTLTVGS